MHGNILADFMVVKTKKDFCSLKIYSMFSYQYQMSFWHRFKHLETCVHGNNQVVLGHGARDKNQGQLVICSLNILVLSHTHKAMINIYKFFFLNFIPILLLYEVSLKPIKERLFAKPCILWSPLALKCYLLVFIRPTSVWQLSPKFTDSYADWRNLFPARKSYLRFIGVSSVTKDCQLSETRRYLLVVHLLSHKPCHSQSRLRNILQKEEQI